MRKTIPFLCCLLLYSVSGFSSEVSLPENNLYPKDKFSINGALGYLGGESNEYAYDETGYMLSHLTWKIKDATIVKGEINLDLLPWFTANANGWMTTDISNAQMDDYDWLNPNQTRWTHWSHHPDTDLSVANNLDVNVRAWFLQNQHYKLGATLGYQEESFAYSAKGGCYQYDNGLFNGCFPSNETMIDYQQTFDATYWGLTGKYLFDKIELNATVKYSPWVDATSIDDHYARNLTFTDQSTSSTFSSLTLAAGYHFSPSTQLFLEASYNQFANSKADILLDDHFTGIYFIKNSGGLSNNNYVLAVGAKYQAGN